jgi:hypothetical protein
MISSVSVMYPRCLAVVMAGGISCLHWSSFFNSDCNATDSLILLIKEKTAGAELRGRVRDALLCLASPITPSCPRRRERRCGC